MIEPKTTSLPSQDRGKICVHINFPVPHLLDYAGFIVVFVVVVVVLIIKL